MNQTEIQLLRDRLDSLIDMRAAFHAVHTSTPNHLTWVRDVLLVGDYVTSDTLMTELELKDAELSAARDTELQAEIDRKAEVQQLKAAYNIVDGWTSLADINLNFLKTFFKRILRDMAD